MEDRDNSEHIAKLFNNFTTIHSLRLLTDNLFWLQSVIKLPQVFY